MDRCFARLIPIRRILDLFSSLRILTPPMETPDPPNDTPGALQQAVLTPHDIPRILRVGDFLDFKKQNNSSSFCC